MANIIDAIEQEQMQGKDIPEFTAGDTVVVKVKVKEGTRERLQAFEGIVIAKRNRGLNSAFTVRKISHGEGVERVFQTYSPMIASIEIKRRGDVRRAKLYYLRDLTGRAAKIKEKITRSIGKKSKKAKVEVPGEAEAIAAAAAAASATEEAPATPETPKENKE